MLDNQIHDLITQLNEESKSLWRIKKEYLDNAEGNDELVKFWEDMEKDKQVHIEKLSNLVRKHL